MSSTDGAKLIAQPSEVDDGASIMSLLQAQSFGPSRGASAQESKRASSESSSSSSSSSRSHSVEKATDSKKAERASRREAKLKRKAERCAKREAKQKRKADRAARREVLAQAAQAKKEAKEVMKAKRKREREKKALQQPAKSKKFNELCRGSLRVWNPDKGFGFIQPEDGGLDIFCYRKSFRSGDCDVRPDGLVTYEIGNAENGKYCAVNIEAVRNAHGIAIIGAGLKWSGGSVRPGDWKCSSCKCNVFAKRKECHKCGRPRLALH